MSLPQQVSPTVEAMEGTSLLNGTLDEVVSQGARFPSPEWRVFSWLPSRHLFLHPWATDRQPPYWGALLVI